MAEVDPGLKFNGFLLKPEEVPTGMTGVVVLEGRDTFETDNGRPLVLRALIGGVAPVRKRFYSATLGGQSEGHFGADIRDFKPPVRLMPVELYSPGEVPPRREFAAFQDGKRLKYKGTEDVVRIKTDAKGRTLSSDGYQYGWYNREYPLPDNAVLIPVDAPKSEKPTT